MLAMPNMAMCRDKVGRDRFDTRGIEGTLEVGPISPDFPARQKWIDFADELSRSEPGTLRQTGQVSSRDLGFAIG